MDIFSKDIVEKLMNNYCCEVIKNYELNSFLIELTRFKEYVNLNNVSNSEIITFNNGFVWNVFSSYCSLNDPFYILDNSDYVEVNVDKICMNIDVCVDGVNKYKDDKYKFVYV